MANSFNSVQIRKPNSNTFDLSHDFKYSMNMGDLVPVLVQEVLPGDKFNIQTETLIRFAPLVAPVMHNIRVFTHYFFVPNRIVWPNWEDFISPDLSKETPPAWPHIVPPAQFMPGSLGDYLGVPTEVSNLSPISALPFAAYQCIYNEYYRDQNLISEIDYKLSNGTNGGALHLRTLRKRAWQHDYFTSALPFAQKGPSVNIPMDMEGVAPVYSNLIGAGSSINLTRNTPSGNVIIPNDEDVPPSLGSHMHVELGEGTAYTNGTINDLRTALKLQEWFEKAARGGSRYVEQLMVHWAVKSSDARLNRPEFLGGTRNPVIISEVLQTSETASDPLATMGGHGISAGSGKRIRYRAEEHGYIIGIQSIMPSTAYQQGIPRHMLRQSWEDYAWPTFAHLGEQPIENRELYALPDVSEEQKGKNRGTFGYIPRYSEYRYAPSRVSGDFKTTLAFWHLGRIFSEQPQLNQQFIEASTNPVNGGIRNDIFAVTDDTQKLWCHSYHKLRVNRKLPKYGTPIL